MLKKKKKSNLFFIFSMALFYMSISLSKLLLLNSLTTYLAEAWNFAETFCRYLM